MAIARHDTSIHGVTSITFGKPYELKSGTRCRHVVIKCGEQELHFSLFSDRMYDAGSMDLRVAEVDDVNP